MDFGFISTHFFCFLLGLSAPLALVIFDNLSIRKRVSCKSKGVKFSTFSTCFVDFVSSSFFIEFCDLFEAIWGSIWHRFSEKNPSGNRSKKRDPHLKFRDYHRVRWLPETPPLIILYKGRRLAGALNSVQFNSIQAQFNSNSIQIELELEMAV